MSTIHRVSKFRNSSPNTAEWCTIGHKPDKIMKSMWHSLGMNSSLEARIANVIVFFRSFAVEGALSDLADVKSRPRVLNSVRSWGVGHSTGFLFLFRQIRCTRFSSNFIFYESTIYVEYFFRLLCRYVFGWMKVNSINYRKINLLIDFLKLWLHWTEITLLEKSAFILETLLPNKCNVVEKKFQ